MLRTELDIFLAMCEEYGTTLGLKAAARAAAGDWEYLSSMEVDPRVYTCPETYLKDAQLCSFFRKHPGLPLGVNTEKAAIANFWEAEKMCFGTNRRLEPLQTDVLHYGSRMGEFITLWRKKIAEVLGKCPSFDELADNLRFGPGSTYRNTGPNVPLAHKLMEGYTRTTTMAQCLPSWESTAWGYHASGCRTQVLPECGEVAEVEPSHVMVSYAPREFEVVRGNRFTTVPKDAKKDRGICVEASLNVAYQLAVGTRISKGLKRVYRWCKKVQQEYHRLLARLGSLTRAVATIDLRMASDTVCIGLVELLLPPDWFALLMRLRSSHTLIEGKWVRLEKFSSMGNGFTFELETLIFLTLAKALEDQEGVREDLFTPGLTTSVFGDDIIVPTSLSETMISCLRFFGFDTNKGKTFVSGLFRESCGGDFMSGYDVRPHFQKEEVSEPRQLISLANGVRRVTMRLEHFGPSRFHYRPWLRCLDAIPSNIRRLRGPVELGDLVIHDSNWQRHNPMRVVDGIRYLSTWSPVRHDSTPWHHFRPGVQMAVALWNCRETDSHDLPDRMMLHPAALQAQALELGKVRSGLPDGVPARINGSYVSGYKVKRVAFS